MLKTIAALVAAAFLVAGCNTVRGFGQDVQKVGAGLERASKK